ncbi:MAG: hypothetical protein ACPL6C_00640, partial [bacterium]
DAIGIVPFNEFLAIAEDILKKNPADAIKRFNNLFEKGKDIYSILESMIANFHRLLLLKIGIKRELPEDIETKLMPLVEIATREDILRIISILARLQTELKYSIRPAYIFEETIVKLSLLDSVVSIKDLVEGRVSLGISAVKRSISEINSGRDELASKTVIGGEHAEVKKEERILSPKERLEELVAKKRGEGISALLENANIIFDESRIILEFPPESETLAAILRRSENFKALEASAKEILDADATVNIIVRAAKKVETKKEEKPKEENDVSPELEKVRKIASEFDATIIG